VNPADWIAVLCLLQPCTAVGGTLHIPVPEVAPRTPSEMWPSYEWHGFKVKFVPIPRTA
jgi:hypothetical protein